MSLGRRIVSIFLVFIVLFGAVYVAPPASAVTPWEHFMEVLGQSALDLLHVSLDISEFVFPITGSCSEDDLVFARDRYNNWLSGVLRSGNLLSSTVNTFFDLHRAVIVADPVNRVRRLRDDTSGEWIVDYNGRYPYVPIKSTDSVPDWATNPAVEYPGTPELSQNSGNLWLELGPIQPKLGSGALSGNTSYSYTQLHDLLLSLRRKSPNVNYRLAPVFGGSYGVCKNNLVLCDSSGRPFIAFREDGSSAANQNQNIYIQNEDGGDVIVDGDKVTTDIKILDKSENVLTIPITNDNSVSVGDFTQQFIYDTSYNFDDHSYTVNTYDVTYNNDNRYYETNYYTWNITYNITNTYVTYIGSNDAWQQEEYKFYYELPDGRSSADLTADEVAALSFQFADCMNYVRSATDVNLRALYHFDGDLSDAGYFSDKTAFTWAEGASITYMDSSAFNGALYLDETAHTFDITLPSNIRAGEDFTVQWRYYQASQPDTVSNVENYVNLGSERLISWDERSLHAQANSTAACSMPIGNWCELALVRCSGVLYLYINGVKVTSWASTGALGKTLTFHFGSTSRAYSMIDELRILNFALALGGESYTPTSVPHDSNLVLVLPGEEKVVDEYWEFSSPNNLLLHPDFTVEDYPLDAGSLNNLGAWCFSNVSGVSPDSVVLEDGFISLGNGSGGSSDLNSTSSVGFQCFLWNRYYDSSSKTYKNAYLSGFTSVSSSTKYTFSVVDTSGQVYSLTFAANSSSASASFPWGKLFYRKSGSTSSSAKGRAALFIDPAKGKTIDVIYTELVAGSSAQVTATKVAAAFDLASLKPNTAAVHTAIPVHGYTVGGVRPTFPVRGDVWFAVTAGRVSSVQVYTGSAWTSSNARWWTGSRWIPIYAFDIFTLEDCWDVSVSEDVITPIDSDTAGWNWWKKAWLDFRGWLSTHISTDDSSSDSEGFWGWWSEQWAGFLTGCGDAVDRIVAAIENIGVPPSDDDGEEERHIPTYYKIDSLSELKPGDYLIQAATEAKGFLTMTNSAVDYLCSESFPVRRGRVTTSNAACVWTLTPVEGGYTLENQSTGAFLYYSPDSGGMLCHANSLPTDSGVWSFSEGGSNGELLGQAVGTSAFLSYGSASDGSFRFTCRSVSPGYGNTLYFYQLDESADSFSALSNLIIDLFDNLGGLVGKLLDWVFDLAADAVSGFGDLGSYFQTTAAELSGFGGEFPEFFGAVFSLIPHEIIVCFSLGLVLFFLSLFVRKVLLS